MTPTHDWLGERALRSPEATSLIFEGERTTFADLDARSWGVADALAAAGTPPGARVALLAGNTPLSVSALHGVPRSGASLVPLNARLTPTELAAQLAIARPAVVLVDAPHAQEARTIAGTATVVPLETIEPGRRRRPRAIADSQVHTVIFTSGTTGPAKGAMLTAGNHYHSAVASMINLGVRADDRWLCCVPLYHVAGLSIVIRSAVFGIPVVLQPEFDPAAVNRSIDQEAVTIASWVPAMLTRVLEARSGPRLPRRFRCALTGGGPLSADLLKRGRDAGVPVTQTYGLTETASQVVTLAPEEALERLGAAGRALWGTRVRVVDGEGAPLGPGQAGEIQIQGPTVMAGYLDDPQATARALAGGWLHTGDIGRLDADGYLTVLDRRTDLIISGGENVYPAEVESALLEHPQVLEAAVVGVPHPEWGQRPLAFVVVRNHLPADVLATHVAQRLAGYKCPDAIVAVDSLPRTAAGKLQRHRLREEALDLRRTEGREATHAHPSIARPPGPGDQPR